MKGLLSTGPTLSSLGSDMKKSTNLKPEENEKKKEKAMEKEKEIGLWQLLGGLSSQKGLQTGAGRATAGVGGEAEA